MHSRMALCVGALAVALCFAALAANTVAATASGDKRRAYAPPAVASGATAARAGGHQHSTKHHAKRQFLMSTFKNIRENFFTEVGHFREDHVRPQDHNALHRGAMSHAQQQHVVGNATSNWGYVNVLAYGAVGDGRTDCTAAFAAALAAGRGGKVFVPAGSYSFGTQAKTQGIVVPPNTVLEGVNAAPFSTWEGGSVLLVRGGKSTPLPHLPFVQLVGDNAAIKGFSILYVDQDPTAASPMVYPPCIQGSGNDLFVSDMLLANPYIAIDFATNSCPRHLISRVYGQPLQVGIQVDQCYDIGRIEGGVHFWPFWAGYAGPTQKGQMVDYVMANAVTFLFYRSDWEVVTDVFSWGYHTGIRFAQSATGATNGQFTNVDFDNVDIGIDAEATQPYGVFVSNLNLANAGNGNSRVAIRGQGGDSQIVVRGMSVWGEVIKVVDWNTGGKFSVDDFVVMNWARSAPAAFDMRGGRVSIRGGYFNDNQGIAVHIHAAVDRAIVTSNDFVGNPIICDLGASGAGGRMCINNLA